MSEKRIRPYHKMDIHEKINFKSMRLRELPNSITKYKNTYKAITNSYCWNYWRFGIPLTDDLKHFFGRKSYPPFRLYEF